MQSVIWRKKSVLFVLAALMLVLVMFIFLSKSLIKTKASSVLDIDGVNKIERLEVLSSTDNNFFILATANGKTHVCSYNSEENVCAVKGNLSFEYTTAASYGNELCVVDSKKLDEQDEYITSAYLCSAVNSNDFNDLSDLSDLNIEKINLGNTKISGKNSFCFLKDTIFFINEKDKSKIIRYNITGDNDPNNNINLENDYFESISSNYDKNKILALTAGGKCILFELNNDGSVSRKELDFKDSSSRPDTFCEFLTDDILISESGTVYTLNNEAGVLSKENVKTETTDGKKLNAIFHDKNTSKSYILNKCDNFNIDCFEITSANDIAERPSKKITFKENDNILALGYNIKFGENKNIVDCVTLAVLKTSNGIEIKLITLENLKEIPTGEEQNEVSENDSYALDMGSRRIILKNSDISTVREFKENFEEGGYTISSFINYLGKEISGSEKIGTGSTVKLSNGSNTLEYKIIVLSDITGEGNVNTKDKTEFFNYLLGKTELTEEVLREAADLNRDNTVDTLDLLELDKMLNK